MDPEFKDQIRSKLQEKDTQELIAIWKENNRTEWSEEAFDAIKEILMNRTGEIPAQSPVADAEEEDVSYYPDRLRRASVWASNLSWAFLGLGLILGTGNLLFVFLNRANLDILALVTSLALWLLVAAVAAFFFVLLQVIAEGVYVLIDIEENTRKNVNRQAEQTEVSS